MPTVITPLRDSNSYIGLAKQSAGGTPIAPTNFPRWLDGSQLTYDLAVEEIREGDSTRRISLVIKNKQMVKVKLVCDPRPIEAGFLEVAALGSASETLTAATTVTTTASVITANVSTTVTLTAGGGAALPGTGNVALILEPGTTNEEVAIFTMPVATNVITLASTYNGGTGTFIKAHASGVAIRTATSHAIADTIDGNYYTIEVNLGGTGGVTMRIRDCKVDNFKRSSKAGKALVYEIEFVGIACAVQPTPSTVTLENHTIFLMTQGVWTLDGSTTGDALNVESFDITQKNMLDTSIQTEQLTLAALIFGAADVEFDATIVYTTNNFFGKTYWGSVGGLADSQVMVPGSLTLIFTQADTFHTIQYNTPTLFYISAPPPAMKVDGKHFTIAIKAKSTSNMGANTYILQTTVQNAQTTAY